MNNPITLMMWMNVNVAYQSLRFCKNMLDAFFPRPAQTADAAPNPLLSAAGLSRGRCLGPADLRG